MSSNISCKKCGLTYDSYARFEKHFCTATGPAVPKNRAERRAKEFADRVVHTKDCELGDNYKDCPACKENNEDS